jgi:O-antigen/teichoic acid export membrane protein
MFFSSYSKLKGFTFFESFKHASFYFSGTLLVQGLGIISLPVMTYFLSEADYGITNVFLSYALVATILLSLNLEGSISRYFLEPEAETKGFLATILLSVTALFLFFSLLIVLYQKTICAWINLPEHLLLLLLLYTYTNIVWYIYVHIRVVEKKSKEMSLAQVLVQYAKFFAAIAGILYVQKQGQAAFMGKIIGELWINALAALVFLWMLRKEMDFSKMQLKYVKYAMAYSIPLVPYAFGGQILSSFDQWYINAYLGHEQAGFYSFAYKMGLLMFGLIIAFLNSTWVQYTEWMDQKKYGDIQNQVFSIHKLSLCAGLFLIFFSVDMGTVLSAKDSFKGSLPIVPIIVLGYIFYGIALLYSRYFNYIKKNGYLTFILIFVSLLNILLNTIYIPKYGYQAAAYTTLFSFICMFFLSWFCSERMSKAPALPAYKIVISLFFFLFIVLVFYLLGWEKLGLDIPVIICKGFVFLSFSFFLFRETIQKIWIKN